MTSSALAGERRWGSARRGGMTVLGKVSVPKPLNLPSQRLENHGLDPNVEIVPKGTLSWGTRSSSSTTNPWGSSSADSKANSPSHLSGRPSSGGSGTRPSTAGSDRVNETSGSPWGPNSRPSSASGILSSDQSSLTSLRPHSADTRPASSHLSRFAEPVSDSQGAWGASGTSERLGMVSSKKDDFSLSTGDFPTLGSEKDQSCNINESKDRGSRSIHVPPSGEAQEKDVMDVAFDRSKRDGSESVGEGLQPSMEKWQAEHQQYFNPNIPPQHFDAWRGPPMNAPPGVWYRGPQGGPPFRPPVGPGGFPIEPFPYYPQIPPPAFSNSHPVPPPRGGPRGHHPKSENPYRPELHDGFMHPGMSYRPGFYPPPMAFEGFYGPPRGYRNPNEPDVPYMNMRANHPVYDRRYSVPSAPGPSDSHARAGGPALSSKKKSDDVDFFHSSDSRMSAKFISKQQGEWDGKEQAGNREYMPGTLVSHPVKADKIVEKPRKYEWGAEDNEDDDIYATANFGGGGNYVPEVVRAKDSQSFDKPTDDDIVKKLDTVSPSSLVSGPKELESASPSTAKDATTLMRKIEGLNAKVRYSGADCSSSGEEQKRGLDVAISKVDTFPRKSGNETPMERNSVYEASFTHEVVGRRDDRMVHHAAAPMSRRPYHGLLNRSDHGSKGKFSNQPADGSLRRPLSAEIPNVVSTSKVESNHNVLECGFQHHLEVAEIDHSSKDERGFVTKLQDPIASRAQRAEMREVAKQRALQRQREEEERIRDQKAKALAKLEELNRRTQSGDSSNPVAKNPVSIETFKEQQEERGVEYAKTGIKGDSPSLVIELKNEGALVNDENQKQAVVSSITSEVAPVRTSKVNNSAETGPLRQDVVDASIRGKSSSELDEGFVQRNKSTSYKQKQNKTAVMKHDENSVSVDSRLGRRSLTDTSVKDREVDDVASSEVSSSIQSNLLDSCNNISQSSVAQRTSTKSSKSNNKQIDAPLVSTAAATGSMQTIYPKTTQEIMMPQAPCLQLSFGTIQVAVNGESGLKMSDQSSSLPREDRHGKVKAQHTRRMPRSQQVNNKLHTNDAAVWAPVRSQNNFDISEEATAKVEPKQEPESGPVAKSDNLGQSSSRSKRAEIERYIPKPVAKELAEQVDMQATLSSVGASTVDDNSSVQPVGSATSVDAGSSAESGPGLAKQNKPGKTHGAWRRRGSTELLHAKNVRQIPSSSDPRKSFLGDVSLNQSYPDSDQLQAVTKTTSERNDSGSKIESLSSDVPTTEMHHVPKDTLITGKGKNYSYGGHNKSGNGQNNDNRNVSNEESERSRVQSPSPDINQSERAITPKENRATSERASSHWKPKAYAHSVSSQKGSRITGNQSGTEDTRANRKDYPLQQRRRSSPQHDESNDIDGSHNELVPETKEPGRGRKLTSYKSSNENPVGEMELGIADSIDVQHVQQIPVASRRSGNQVNRSGRGHESHGDLSVQGYRQHDRLRHMHYEYQPVGSVDYKKNNFEGQVDGTGNAGSRNRGRGHSHSRRGGGNFRVPQSEHLQLATD
ncbi:hypothetical protein LIER_09403 [Lithospermum erythrorhizon]|uniref:BAT2 N-terminal domain-containing protein n=1 Tax=Lithospermum erythrorhizon TaxID=34254 RepID=A0AAV3PHT0_LITER